MHALLLPPQFLQLRGQPLNLFLLHQPRLDLVSSFFLGARALAVVLLRVDGIKETIENKTTKNPGKAEIGSENVKRACLLSFCCDSNQMNRMAWVSGNVRNMRPRPAAVLSATPARPSFKRVSYACHDVCLVQLNQTRPADGSGCPASACAGAWCAACHPGHIVHISPCPGAAVRPSA